MSNDSANSAKGAVAPQSVGYADLQAHVVKVKASWAAHQLTMTWEQKIKVIERMREREAQLRRSRESALP